jgi:FKBP12-rapamycin complex-associated protein
MYPKLLDTILNKIKREDTPKIRCELVRLLGIVGAVDPYKHKMLQLTLLEDDNEKKVAGRAEEIMKGVSLNSDDYYPAVALSTLIKFLRNPYGSLAQFQPMVVQSVMTIFKSLGIKSTSYLRHFMPLFTHVMKVCGDTLFGLRELVFQQLCVLVSIIKHYTRDYLGELFQV